MGPPGVGSGSTLPSSDADLGVLPFKEETSFPASRKKDVVRSFPHPWGRIL